MAIFNYSCHHSKVNAFLVHVARSISFIGRFEGTKVISEYFYFVGEEDNIVGKATREECHVSNWLIYRSVYIFVLNDKNEIFLQRRSMSKDLYPDYYIGSVTGHVDSSEDYDDAARRELKEELDINIPLERLCKFKSFSGIEREISVLCLCRYNGPFQYNKKEISEVIFMSVEEIKINPCNRREKVRLRFQSSLRRISKNTFKTSQRRLLNNSIIPF